MARAADAGLQGGNLEENFRRYFSVLFSWCNPGSKYTVTGFNIWNKNGGRVCHEVLPEIPEDSPIKLITEYIDYVTGVGANGKVMFFGASKDQKPYFSLKDEFPDVVLKFEVIDKKQAEELRQFFDKLDVKRYDPILKPEHPEYIYLGLKSLVKSDFFKQLHGVEGLRMKKPGLVEVAIFCNRLEQEVGKRQKFVDSIYEIVTNLDHYISYCVGNGDKRFGEDLMKNIRDDVSGKKDSGNSSVYAFKKKTGYEYKNYVEIHHEKNEGFLLQHVRVPIDRSPYWISIDIITGEFVISVDERYMFLGDFTGPFNDIILNALKQDKRFAFLKERVVGREPYFYRNPQRLYFTDEAFKRLHLEKEPESKVTKVAAADAVSRGGAGASAAAQ